MSFIADVAIQTSVHITGINVRYQANVVGIVAERISTPANDSPSASGMPGVVRSPGSFASVIPDVLLKYCAINH